MKTPVNQYEKKATGKTGKAGSSTGRNDSHSRKMDDDWKKNQSLKNDSSIGRNDSKKNVNRY